MQYKRGWLRFTSWCRGPAPQQATSRQSLEARTHGGLELAKGGQKADTWHTHTHGGHTYTWGRHRRRTRFGGAAKADTWRTQGGFKADTWQTQGGHMVDTQGLKAHSRRTQGGQTADTRRTHGGQSVEMRPERNQGGWMADTWRTSSGDAAKHIAANFSSERGPHSKLFGENLSPCLG